MGKEQSVNLLTTS